MSRYRLRVTLLLDHAIDRPERAVERVVARAATIVPRSPRASGMTAVDGFAMALHVEHMVDAHRDAASLEAELSRLLGRAFEGALRARPTLCVTLVHAGRPVAAAPATRFADSELRDATVAASVTPATA